ncbi:MAG: cytochrome c oxidase subunit 3 [Lewinellaceae bacterium]|nr:cytochrome c oxidase subunit 3 [Lewinellaceae bacterium]
METRGGNTNSSEDYLDEYQSFAFHPYNVLLMLTLFGLGALFLALSLSFVYTRVQNGLPPIQLPPIFLANTLILMASSWMMIRAKQAYLADNTVAYQRALIWTILLSIVFMAAQAIGWRELFRQEIFINSDNSASYLYVISGLHFAHVIAGLPFLIGFLITAYRRMQEPVSVLVYFSDPEKRLKLRLLTIYWHFLDGLWIYLVLFFFVNALLQ